MLKFKNNTSTTRVDKLVSFIQHDLPGIQDGTYQLSIAQQVKDSAGTIVSDNSLQTAYDFFVAGDRFSFANPSQTLYSLFPPDQATGKYDAVFPSVVFTKTTLPWNRSPLKNSDKITKNGTDTDEDVPTWMTILLLDEQDMNAFSESMPDLSPVPVVRTLGDLLPSSLYAASSLGKNYSYFQNVSDVDPQDVFDPGQKLTDPVTTLDVPVPLFLKLAPSPEDLKYMAHIRRVSLVNKPTMTGISDIGEPEGDFSIVFGNRLPGTDRKSYAALVSLEGMEELLPPKGSGLEGDRFVRLAVLHSWTFYSTGDNASFTNRLKNLNASLPAQEGDPVNKDLDLITNLRLPAPANAGKQVTDILRMGYLPANHHLRTSGQNGAEKTVSWYRGPLLPYKETEIRVTPPILSADKATLFDPTTGMFDLSYSAAWSIGRQLALADKDFSTKLFNWKRGLQNSVDNYQERLHFKSAFSGCLSRHPANRTVKGPDHNMETTGDDSLKDFLREVVLSLHEK